MALNVTSWWIEQAQSKTSEPTRKFTIGSSDYSDRVVKWPKFKNAANDIRPRTLTIDLANEDMAMNFFRDDKTTLRNNCSVEWGFTHPTSGDELVAMFSGTTRTVKYSRGRTSITIEDKFQQLADRVMGSSDNPLSYTNSDYYPSDLAWYAITSYGGFDATTSTANIDIDWDSFHTWASVFSSNNIRMQGYYEGLRVNEALRKIGRQTFSSIFVYDGKLYFHRYSIADSNSTTFDNDSIEDLGLSVIEDSIINKQYVFANYSVTSDYFLITVEDEDTSSVNSFSLKEHIEKDEVIWHVNSGSAVDLAQRKIQVYGEPYDAIKLKTNLFAMNRLLGETATVVDSFLGVNGGFRIMEIETDMDKGLIHIGADRTQFFNAFVLDTSTLDSSEVLT